MSKDADAGGHAYDDTLFRQLAQEESLIVNRLSWLVAAQAFLFTAYAVVLNGASATSARGGAIFEARQDQLLKIVPALGLATCALIYLGVLAGVRVVALLRRELRQDHGGRLATGRTGRPPPLPGTGTTHALGSVAPLLLPRLFFATWAWLLLGG